MFLRIDSAIITQLKRVFSVGINEQVVAAEFKNRSIQKPSSLIVTMPQASPGDGKENYHEYVTSIMKSLKSNSAIRRLERAHSHDAKNVAVRTNCRSFR